MRDLSDEEVAEEVRLIGAQQGWPMWPLLPVKNLRRGEPDYPKEDEVGVVLANDLTTVWIKNLFDFEEGTIGAQLEGVKKVEFDTVEDMVRAGWIGD